MAIVVTGATGQLGRRVVAHLLARGTKAHDVLAAGRNGTRLDEVATGGVRKARIDYDEPASLRKAFGRGDTLLFVSGSTPGHRMDQHRAVVEAAVDARVERIVYTSITGADAVDTVLTPDHRATEQLIAESGLPFALLRNNLYAEVQVDKVVQAAATNEFTAGWGDGRIAGAGRDDYAEAAAVVLADPSLTGAFELDTATSWGGQELAVAAEALLGKPVTYTENTSDETEIQLALAEVPEPTRRFVIALDTDIRDHAFERTGSVLESLIGRPATPLVEALRGVLPRDLPQPTSTAATRGHSAAG